MFRSALFRNARALSAASVLASSDAGSRRATLEITISRLPKHWGFFVCTGISYLVNLLEHAAPGADEVKAASSLGCISPHLADLMTGTPWSVDVNVPTDGTLAFVGDPLATVEGPLWQAWLFSAIVTSSLTSHGLVATRAARLALAAGSVEVIDATSCLLTNAEHAVLVARSAYVGGTRCTQNPDAALRLGIELRVTPPADCLSLAEQNTTWTSRTTGDSALIHLGPGDDEEETLSDFCRTDLQVGGWEARGLARETSGFELRTALVALEQQGVWKPRMGAIADVTVVPGRKLVVRYFDGAGHPIADVMHGVSERIQPAQDAVVVGHLGTGLTLPLDGAVTGLPLLTSLLRSGRRVGADESLDAARARVKSGIQVLSEPYRRLRHPSVFPVGVTPALAKLRGDMVAGLVQ